MRACGAISLILALAAVSCTAPRAHEEFLKAPRESYDFVFSGVDTISLYDISFYTRYDVLKKRSDMLQLDITWTDPDDSTYCETLYMERGDRNGVEARYRTGLYFIKPGDWTLSVAVSGETELLRGLGIIWNKQNGTR